MHADAVNAKRKRKQLRDFILYKGSCNRHLLEDKGWNISLEIWSLAS
jgi:hypothetical protein